MRVTISSRTCLVDDVVRGDVCRRVRSTLGQFNPRIDEVVVRIGDKDADAAHGSSRWLCRLSVRMKRLGSFSIDSVEDDLATAVSQAADRAAKQVRKILDH